MRRCLTYLLVLLAFALAGGPLRAGCGAAKAVAIKVPSVAAAKTEHANAHHGRGAAHHEPDQGAAHDACGSVCALGCCWLALGSEPDATLDCPKAAPTLAHDAERRLAGAAQPLPPPRV